MSFDWEVGLNGAIAGLMVSLGNQNPIPTIATQLWPTPNFHLETPMVQMI